MKGKTLSYTEQDRRYWRRQANLRVRKARIFKTALKWSCIALFNLAIAAALLFTAGRAMRHASNSPEFSVAGFEVVGAERTSRKSVTASLDHLLGASLMETDLQEAAAIVEKLPWVRGASVKRKLPRTLQIKIVERQPVVHAVIGGLVRLVDGTGHVIVPLGPRASFDFPVITGLERLEAAELRQALLRGIAILDRLRHAEPTWVACISTLDMSRDDRVAVTTTYPGPRLLLDPNMAERNVNQFIALSTEIAKRFGDAEYVDLRFKDSISVMPGAES